MVFREFDTYFINMASNPKLIGFMRIYLKLDKFNNLRDC
jgi:hypothetical protein